MGIKDKEHYDLLEQFEREYPYGRKEKEPKDLWAKGFVYQDGNMNNLFLAFRKGYSFCKAI